MKFKLLNKLERIKGLALTKYENAVPVKFKPTKQGYLHTVFVKFPLLIIWENEGKFVYANIYKPWSLQIKPINVFDMVYEIPLTEKQFKFLQSDLTSRLSFYQIDANKFLWKK